MHKPLEMLRNWASNIVVSITTDDITVANTLKINIKQSDSLLASIQARLVIYKSNKQILKIRSVHKCTPLCLWQCSMLPEIRT